MNIMKVIKIITIVLLVVVMLTFATSDVFAKVDPDAYNPGNISLNGSGNAMQLAKKIVGVISMVAGVIYVATIMVMGIKYMTASIEEKANYKKTMVPLLVGGAMIFGISGILRLILDIVPDSIS